MYDGTRNHITKQTYNLKTMSDSENEKSENESKTSEQRQSEYISYRAASTFFMKRRIVLYSYCYH